MDFAHNAFLLYTEITFGPKTGGII